MGSRGAMRSIGVSLLGLMVIGLVSLASWRSELRQAGVETNGADWMFGGRVGIWQNLTLAKNLNVGQNAFVYGPARLSGGLQVGAAGRRIMELWPTSFTMAGTAGTSIHITLAGCTPTNSYAFPNITNPLLATGLAAEAKVETGLIDVKINQATSATLGLVTMQLLVLRR